MNNIKIIINIIITVFALILNNIAHANKLQQELQQTQKKIKQANTFLAKNKLKLNSQQKKLKTIELKISTNAKQIFNTKLKLKNIKQELPKLKKQLVTLQHSFSKQQQLLSQQLKECYFFNNNSSLKLLLTPAQPDTILRVQYYQQYIYQALTKQMSQSKLQIAALTKLQNKIATQNKQLISLQHKLQQKHASLEQEEKNRTALLYKLNRNHKKTNKELKALLENEKNLIEQLKHLRGVFQVPSQNFAKYKSNHSWPLKIKRSSSKYFLNHVIMPAIKGDTVQAIFSGRVIFANWLRGFGLLLIIDHGDGYMSLYGHNQALFKRVGDWVEQNDLLALVGQSGGHDNLSLYFEIRKNGKAINLQQWFKR